MAKNNLTKCFSCFSGYDCCNTKRLPRKKKKELKNFLKITNKYRYHYFMEFVSSCDIAESYKHYKKMFNSTKLILNFKKEIDFLRKQMECENEIYIDDKGRLSWYWESDDDYGGSSGLMPFCYSEEEAKDTWAFSELKGLLFNLIHSEDEIRFKDFIFPKKITSDVQLLKFIKNAKLI